MTAPVRRALPCPPLGDTVREPNSAAPGATIGNGVSLERRRKVVVRWVVAHVAGLTCAVGHPYRYYVCADVSALVAVRAHSRRHPLQVTPP
jgi:hypothetical protein